MASEQLPGDSAGGELNATQEIAAKAPGPDAAKLLAYAQLGLRLLGVLLVADGMATTGGGLVHAVYTAKGYARSGYDYLLDPTSMSYFGMAVPQLLVGLYLVADGSWVLKKVFMPAPKASEEDEAEPPKNEPNYRESVK